jgi:hypothetical protein
MSDRVMSDRVMSDRVMSEQAPSASYKARSKLLGVLGKERGELVIADTMRAAGISSLETPGERYRFGVELTKQRGLLEAIGRAIMVQAILQGANAP